MAPDDDAPVEPEEEGLADRVDPFEHPAVDRASDPRRETSWVRALGLDALAGEYLQAAGDPMQAVAFWHLSAVEL
jgi:hypothetical protein